MKKLIILSFAVIATVTSLFAELPKTPACAIGEYPDLYDGDWSGPMFWAGDTTTYVTMTIPITKVTYAGIGAKYFVTHPIPGNECNITTSAVNDTQNESIRILIDLAAKYPRAISKMDIGIQLTYVNGKTDGIWRLHTSGRPIEPEKM